MKVFAVLLFASIASAQTPVEHAAATVARIHDQMLDPASFVLDGAFVTKPDKHGQVSYCYAFRSHNHMGGYSEGRATEAALDHGRLNILSASADSGNFQGYDVGWFAPCKTKNIDKNLTADVAALATTLYRKAR